MPASQHPAAQAADTAPVPQSCSAGGVCACGPDCRCGDDCRCTADANCAST